MFSRDMATMVTPQAVMHEEVAVPAAAMGTDVVGMDDEEDDIDPSDLLGASGDHPSRPAGE